jgi:molybdenum cofactor guanylyltransferase
MKNDLVGLVLCGGESRRMGTDKGLIMEGDTICAKIVGDKMVQEGLEVYYSINALQVQNYSKHIAPDKLIIDSNECPGPLRGLLSAHESIPGKDLLLLACDMPDIMQADIRKLITAWEVQEADYFAYRDNEYFQTFCAIYTLGGLNALDKTGCESMSLQKILHNNITFPLEIGNIRSFANYNYK